MGLTYLLFLRVLNFIRNMIKKDIALLNCHSVRSSG